MDVASAGMNGGLSSGTKRLTLMLACISIVASTVGLTSVIDVTGVVDNGASDASVGVAVDMAVGISEIAGALNFSVSPQPVAMAKIPIKVKNSDTLMATFCYGAWHMYFWQSLITENVLWQ